MLSLFSERPKWPELRKTKRQMPTWASSRLVTKSGAKSARKCFRLQAKLAKLRATIVSEGTKGSGGGGGQQGFEARSRSGGAGAARSSASAEAQRSPRLEMLELASSASHPCLGHEGLAHAKHSSSAGIYVHKGPSALSA